MRNVRVAGCITLLASSVLWGGTVAGTGGDPGDTTGDLFDLGLGTVVNGGSPVIGGCDLRDVLGGTFGNNTLGCEGAGKILYNDSNSGPWPFGPTPPSGSSNYYLTFTTPATVNLSSYTVYMEDDFNQAANRTVSEFRLYLDDGAGNPVTLLSDFMLLGAGETDYLSVYGSDSISLSDTFASTAGTQFSAVFTSNPLAASDAAGPRVFELDGFGEVADPSGAPEPGTLVLVGLAALGILLKRR